MSELLSCPFCGGEIQVTAYDEDFYRQVFGADYECNKDYLIEHVDRLAAAKAKCPFEMATYSTEAEAVAAWNARAERTCRNTGESRVFQCSECGFGLWDVYMDDETEWGASFCDFPPYCPNCGARVERGDE